MGLKSSWLLLALAVGCTKPNPEVCCLDADDCAAAGIPEGRTCASDLVCLNHRCEVPACTESSQCDPTQPICDLTTYACRGCSEDDECESGACADDGTCAPESEILYVAPNAPDAGDCPRAAPCGSVNYARSKGTAARYRIVLAPGNYTVSAPIQLLQTMTMASTLSIHGHNASITAQSGSFPLVLTSIPVVLRDIELFGTADDDVITVGSDLTLKRVNVVGGRYAVAVASSSAPLTIDQALLVGTQSALVVHPGHTPSVKISNMIARGSTTDTVVDLGAATGEVSFTTIAYGGSSADPQGIRCRAAVTLRSSIVWTPEGTAPPTTGCLLDNVIAGPFAVLGARSTDPQFVNAAAGDLHLMATSPALDAAAEGPLVDFEGDPRPSGAGFDLGADERTP